MSVYTTSASRGLGLGPELEDGAGVGGYLLRLVYELFIREELQRCAGDEVHTQLRAADHERVAHVVARVAHVDELYPLERAEVLTYGEHIRKDLSGVEFVCKPVPDGDGGILREFFDYALSESAVLDAVKHA